MAERSPRERDIVDRHLARAWEALKPAPYLEASVRARLTGSAAANLGAVGLGIASNTRPESAWVSLQASGKLGLVGAGLLGLGLLSGYLLRYSQEAPPRATVTHPSEKQVPAPPPPTRGPEPGAERRVPGAESAPPLARPARVRRLAKPPAIARDAMDSNGVDSESANPSDELALLRRADRAVRAGNAALALALIAELETHHPRSPLLEERRAIELLAYCVAGATDAGTRATRFLREHPSSVYAGRIRQACPREGDSSAPEPR